MEFKDMQVIWNEQSQEKLFAVDENGLHKHIKSRGSSVLKYVWFMEAIMIGMNLLIGLYLIYDAFKDNNPLINYGLPVIYLGFAIYAAWRRFSRRNSEREFETTMVGDLDKAIWRIKYLDQMGKRVYFWYLLPLAILFVVMAFFDRDLIPWAGMMILVLPATYYASKWEANKWHKPNLKDLESLRQTLLESA